MQTSSQLWLTPEWQDNWAIKWKNICIIWASNNHETSDLPLQYCILWNMWWKPLTFLVKKWPHFWRLLLMRFIYQHWNCQAQVWSPKVQSPKVKTKGTWTDTKITWATHPTHPLTFKHEGVKKVLKVKVAHNDPLDSSSPKNWPGGQPDWGHGVVLHVQGEVYQSTLSFTELGTKIDALDPSSEKFWFVSPRSVLNWT